MKPDYFPSYSNQMPSAVLPTGNKCFGVQSFSLKKSPLEIQKYLLLLDSFALLITLLKE